ncbi:uncharacterized protein BcabD6B2_08080 [Babesia caballi]|uniref:Uncharacterized protein n=1 Tax=Babesia caballi TaxID=5871 RepID=A0AAV4LNC1_BABCB|nr:hypothetical protein BcabD6B2_08080 [Babesia caballi]
MLALLEPGRQLDHGNGVVQPLQNGRNAHQLQQLRVQPLAVVLPVQNVAHAHVHSRAQTQLQPPRQALSLQRRADLEGLQGHRTSRARGLRRVRREQKGHVQVAVMQVGVVVEQLGQTARGRNAEALQLPLADHRLLDRLARHQKVEHVVVLHVGGVRVEGAAVAQADRRRALVRLRLGRPQQVPRKDLLLQQLNHAHLAAPLDLEPLQLDDLLLVVEDHVPLLQQLLRALRRRQEHGVPRPVELEEDLVAAHAAVPAHVLHLEVLVVRPQALNQPVQQRGHVLQLDHLAGLRLRRAAPALEVHHRGEHVRQHAPDPVRVQLDGDANVLDQPVRRVDDLRARVGHDGPHFHAVPARAPALDVPVEAVKNALVRQLQRVVQQDAVARLLDADRVALGLAQQALERRLGVLLQLLVHVALVAELQHRLHVKGVLTLADYALDVHLLVHLRLVEHALRVGLDHLLQLAAALALVQAVPRTHLIRRGQPHARPQPLVLLVGAARVALLGALRPRVLQGRRLVRPRLQILHQGQNVAAVDGRYLQLLLPLHPLLADLRLVVVGALLAELLRHDGGGLQALREDDVGVHGRDVQVVDAREGVERRLVAQPRQTPPHVAVDLLEIGKLGEAPAQPHRRPTGVLRAPQPVLAIRLGITQNARAHVTGPSEPNARVAALLPLAAGVGATIARQVGVRPRLERDVQVVQQLLVLFALHVEPLLQVVPEQAAAQRGHAGPNVRVFVNQVVLRRRRVLEVADPRLLVLVREEHPVRVGLRHQQALAQRAAPLPQHLLGRQRHDVAQREHEAVDVLHVQIVGRHRVRDAVHRQRLRVVLRVGHHLLRVQLRRVVLELDLAHLLQRPRAEGQVRVALHPLVAVQVHHRVAAERVRRPPAHAQRALHREAVQLRPPVHVREVEGVPVVRHEDVRRQVHDQREEAPQQLALALLVEDLEAPRPRHLLRGVVRELADVARHHAAVHDQVALPVEHHRDQDDLVALHVGELQGRLVTLDVPREHVQRRQRGLVQRRQVHCVGRALHVVPRAAADRQVDAHPVHVPHVVLVDIPQLRQTHRLLPSVLRRRAAPSLVIPEPGHVRRPVVVMHVLRDRRGLALPILAAPGGAPLQRLHHAARSLQLLYRVEADLDQVPDPVHRPPRRRVEALDVVRQRQVDPRAVLQQRRPHVVRRELAVQVVDHLVHVAVADQRQPSSDTKYSASAVRATFSSASPAPLATPDCDLLSEAFSSDSSPDLVTQTPSCTVVAMTSYRNPERLPFSIHRGDRAARRILSICSAAEGWYLAARHNIPPEEDAHTPCVQQNCAVPGCPGLSRPARRTPRPRRRREKAPTHRRHPSSPHLHTDLTARSDTTIVHFIQCCLQARSAPKSPEALVVLHGVLTLVVVPHLPVEEARGALAETLVLAARAEERLRPQVDHRRRVAARRGVRLPERRRRGRGRAVRQQRLEHIPRARVRQLHAQAPQPHRQRLPRHVARQQPLVPVVAVLADAAQVHARARHVKVAADVVVVQHVAAVVAALAVAVAAADVAGLRRAPGQVDERLQVLARLVARVPPRERHAGRLDEALGARVKVREGAAGLQGLGHGHAVVLERDDAPGDARRELLGVGQVPLLNGASAEDEQLGVVELRVVHVHAVGEQHGHGAHGERQVLAQPRVRHEPQARLRALVPVEVARGEDAIQDVQRRGRLLHVALVAPRAVHRRDVEHQLRQRLVLVPLGLGVLDLAQGLGGLVRLHADDAAAVGGAAEALEAPADPARGEAVVVRHLLPLFNLSVREDAHAEGPVDDVGHAGAVGVAGVVDEARHVAHVGGVDVHVAVHLHDVPVAVVRVVELGEAPAAHAPLELALRDDLAHVLAHQLVLQNVLRGEGPDALALDLAQPQLRDAQLLEAAVAAVLADAAVGVVALHVPRLVHAAGEAGDGAVAARPRLDAARGAQRIVRDYVAREVPELAAEPQHRQRVALPHHDVELLGAHPVQAHPRLRAQLAARVAKELPVAHQLDVLATLDVHVVAGTVALSGLVAPTSPQPLFPLWPPDALARLGRLAIHIRPLWGVLLPSHAIRGVSVPEDLGGPADLARFLLLRASATSRVFPIAGRFLHAVRRIRHDALVGVEIRQGRLDVFKDVRVGPRVRHHLRQGLPAGPRLYRGKLVRGSRGAIVLSAGVPMRVVAGGARLGVQHVVQIVEGLEVPHRTRVLGLDERVHVARRAHLAQLVQPGGSALPFPLFSTRGRALSADDTLGIHSTATNT